jgi:hypothetical protein
MDQRAFNLLYANLSSLVEQALKRLAATMLAQPSEVSAPSVLSQEERDAQVMAGFENLDFSALEGLDLSGSNGITTDGEPDVDALYRLADLPAIEASLRQLPSHLHPLTDVLSEEEMAAWLAVYEDGNEVLVDLATEIRRLANDSLRGS